MKNLTIRWTFGESNARELSSQALDMLDMSIKFGKMIFNRFDKNISYNICYNNLSENIYSKLQKISYTNRVPIINVSNKLPENLINKQQKNSWWKYAPPRIDINSYEIIMDNDLILWNIPNTLKKAINNSALVVLTDGAGTYYGEYTDEVLRKDSNLKLNAGLLGLPPRYVIDPNEVNNRSHKDFFHSEQGFTALKFVSYKGEKYQIPLNEIQQINVNQIEPRKLIKNYDGAHFCGCSFGHYNFWNDCYSEFFNNHYSIIRRSQ